MSVTAPTSMRTPESSSESRRTLPKMDQTGRDVPEILPVVCSGRAMIQKSTASIAMPSLPSPVKKTLISMSLKATQLPTPLSPNKAYPVGVSPKRLQHFASPVRSKGILQPQSLFSPSRGRRHLPFSDAEAVTPPRSRPPPDRGTSSIDDPMANHTIAEADVGLVSPTVCRTPVMQRVMGAHHVVISPAHSEDARQLMFLSTHNAYEEVSEEEAETPVSAARDLPKAAPAKASGAQYISQRNRAAALARWQKRKEGPQHSEQADSTRTDFPPVATAGGGKRSSHRHRFDAKDDDNGTYIHVSGVLCPSDRQESGRMQPLSPLRRASTTVLGNQSSATMLRTPTHQQASAEGNENKAPAAAMKSPVDAGAQEGEADDETFVPRSSKRRRRSCAGVAPYATPQGTFQSPDAPRSGKMRRGAPPGPEPPRDPTIEQLTGEFTTSETVWVEVPGRPSFQLQRLCGAPHGLPGLALRQVQCAVVPHTDRTSAFYLAMVRAAEQVGGLVRSATRAEMSLLSSSGAVAKGACRASLATFPAICRGLWRLGVDDMTLQALMALDVRSNAAMADTAVTKMKPSALTFDLKSPEANQQGQGNASSDVERPDKLPAPGSSHPRPAGWISPPGISEGSEHTILKERAVAFAPWTPSEQTAGKRSAEGAPDSALRCLSSGRRSKRVRHSVKHDFSCRVQEGMLSDGGSQEAFGDDQRRSNADSDVPSRSELKAVVQQKEGQPLQQAHGQQHDGEVQQPAAPLQPQAPQSHLQIDSAWLQILQRSPPPALLAMLHEAREQNCVTDTAS